MRILVTGSAGHLGEAIMRTLRAQGQPVLGVDRLQSDYTDRIGSLVDRAFVEQCAEDVSAIIHTATLHKPHVETHSRQDFVDTNVSATLNLLEVAKARGIERFVFTSTTSAFGAALSPSPGQPAAWIDETVASIPKNIYGVTKTAAEDLCQLFARRFGVPVVVLRTSRFFPEIDDSPETRDNYSDQNAKANEFLFRRVDIEDAVTAHLKAVDRAPAIGFARLIVSATTPFQKADLAELRTAAPEVAARYCPDFVAEYAHRNWKMFAGIDRVYDNAEARAHLNWQPRYDFDYIVKQLQQKTEIGSDLARVAGIKGYHAGTEQKGVYPFV